MNQSTINQLDNDEEIRIHLFEKGFLITDDDYLDTAKYPFYSNWRLEKKYNFNFLTHKNTQAFFCERNGNTFFLIGHAYNPYTIDFQENIILEKLAQVFENKERYLNLINELTGIYIIGVVNAKGIEFTLDASAQQCGCYGTVKGKHYITSHMRLVGDICNLTVTDYVRRLIGYKWYHYMMGNYLPGELTCFDELTRVVCNTYVVLTDKNYVVERFYPSKEIDMCQTEEQYAEVIKEAAQIMSNTMKLIPMKWNKPAISLTGGIDSNTTFAAANGVYDKYTTFSYISMHRESVDAAKAREISARFEVPHHEYLIPETNEEIKKFKLYKEILEWNDGGIGFYRDNELRKKITLIEEDVCDVEVKSWISETIRAYAYKYFGRSNFKFPLTPRNYTSLYKIFLLNRRLVHETDIHFENYIRNTKLREHLFNYDESDFFVWEMMHGEKCGLDIGVMRSCFDITIPYNNRKLLDTLLRVPLEKRINDQLHLDLKKLLNRELYDMNIRVVNLNETDKRKKILNLYYSINSILPF